VSDSGSSLPWVFRAGNCPRTRAQHLGVQTLGRMWCSGAMSTNNWAEYVDLCSGLVMSTFGAGAIGPGSASRTNKRRPVAMRRTNWRQWAATVSDEFAQGFDIPSSVCRWRWKRGGGRSICFRRIRRARRG